MPDINYILEAEQLGLELKCIQKVARRWTISLNDAAELMVNFEKQQGYYRIEQEKLYLELISEGKSLQGKIDKKEYKLMIEGSVVFAESSTKNKNSIDSYDIESISHRRLNTIDLTNPFFIENTTNSYKKNSDINSSRKLANINSDTNISNQVFYDTSISSNNSSSNCKISHSETCSELDRKSHSETGSNKTGSEHDRIFNESIHLNNIDNDRHLDSANIPNNVENNLTTSIKLPINSKTKLLNRQETNRSYFKRVSICCCF